MTGENKICFYAGNNVPQANRKEVLVHKWNRVQTKASINTVQI